MKQLVVSLEASRWQTAMQPAKPFAFGRLGTSFFGLPGNPVSVMVAFEQFTRPALLQMMGSEKLFRPPSPTAPWAAPRPSGQDRLPGPHLVDGGTLYAESSGGQSSNVLSALAAADAFAVVPEGVSNVPAGGPVTLELFRPRVPHRRGSPWRMSGGTGDDLLSPRRARPRPHGRCGRQGRHGADCGCRGCAPALRRDPRPALLGIAAQG